jgi:hypothetical protein
MKFNIPLIFVMIFGISARESYSQSPNSTFYLYESIQSKQFSDALKSDGFKVQQLNSVDSINPSSFPGSESDNDVIVQGEDILISISFIELTGESVSDRLYEEATNDLKEIFKNLSVNRENYSIDFCWEQINSSQIFEYQGG